MHRAWMMYKKNPVILIVIVPLLAGAAACGFGVAATWTYNPAPKIATSFIIAMVRPSTSASCAGHPAPLISIILFIAEQDRNVRTDT